MIALLKMHLWLFNKFCYTYLTLLKKGYISLVQKGKNTAFIYL